MHTYTHTHTHTYIAGDRKADGGVQKPKKDQDIHSSKPNANRLKTQEEPMFQFKSKDRKEWIYYLDSPQGGGAPSHSVLFGPSTDRMRSTHIRDSDLLYSVYHSTVKVMQKHPHRNTQIMFKQIPGHPVAQSSWHIKLTIILINVCLSVLVFAVNISEE